MLTQPLKWHGGKHYLAKKIIERMPRHRHYVEPYCGGAAVLLQRDPNDQDLWWPGEKGVSELINDLDSELMSFWRVLQRPQLFDEFVRVVSAIPLSRQEFDEAEPSRVPGNLVESAVRFFVRARQSRAGTFKGFTQITRNRLRRGVNGNASEWLSAVDGLSSVHARLRPVVLEKINAIKLIKREDEPATFFYIDAPYVSSTRTCPEVFKFEMTDDQHIELINTLVNIRGRAAVSMYHHPIYDALSCRYGWKQVEFNLPNNAAGGKQKKRMVEVLWMNY